MRSIEKVKVTDEFWRTYMKVVRDEVIPYQWDALNDKLPDTEPSHAIENFKIAAGESGGEYFGMVFQDSDVAKWLEAVAFSLENDPNPSLEKIADEVIDLLGRAQQPDGYLNTYYIVKEPGLRWTNLRDNHEMYCAGHLMEAAVAYYNVTGKRKFLDIMCKFADHIVEMFGSENEKQQGYPGHPEIELALVKLYSVTGENRYLQLSKFFIDQRGQKPNYFDLEKEERGDTKPFWFNGSQTYHQGHLPVREQDKAVGHSVRAIYLYIAMADIAEKTNDASLKEVCDTLWDNVTKQQMYITAGVGSSEFGESFSFDYDLPNDLSYTETCASIALVFWAKRMLNLEVNSKYADIMERALYNGTISGMDLDGKKFFYVNPLEVWPVATTRHEKRHVKPVRQKWFTCACCPPNLARMISSIGHYIYSQGESELFVHLYVGSQTNVDIKGESVTIVQETDYPWDEKVSLTISPENESKFSVALRIPNWCKAPELKVNGEVIDVETVVNNGYAYLNRSWKKGDKIELLLPMAIEQVRANPKVRENAGKVALQRGPIVYCLEEVDNGKNLPSISLPRDSKLQAHKEPSTLGGIVTISGSALRVDQSSWTDELYSTREHEKSPIQFKAIPYYAWCNRTPGEMLVWITED
ncbi:glycoside hydrolase family 127 protein [Aquibacillus saliphilus]|uniref:glycoside hydrolase family 127 protein n=1 Tax=Aquibacillus saliphilus TaxID=1909422 RepID=UPI001CF02D7A|nr:beta-L-arabinofuranosidase domain-containing protein [Aquibacillus saliphilus]